MKKVPYYPGCTLKTTAKSFEVSALESAKVLGFELVEIPDWTCCGTVFSLASDTVMHHVAAVRNLVHVQAMGDNKLLTLCSMCYNTLKQVNQLVRNDPEKLETINRFIQPEEEAYRAEVRVIHMLEYLRDEIGFDNLAKKVKTPLKGLKVVPYYGCMLLRPKGIGIDDPEQPTIMEDFIRALGAEVVDNPLKNECCGAYHTVDKKDLVAERAYKIITAAEAQGGEIMITSCPLCHFNLDKRQERTLELHPEFKQMPIMYFTQLLALALGLDEEYLGLDGNYIDPRPILEEKRLLPVKKEVDVKS
ncbi:MAG: CoB--CoM heterodisulfide reductase iron-sulfur subunit B family protein [Candidatus Odinarchaeota archaeon]|nr:CoB--CoM heterodisulfide reductase iron-sulfur subunit B family protein [Candidatus Odinarchaeota archaeon]